MIQPYILAGALAVILATNTATFFIGRDAGKDGCEAKHAAGLRKALKDKEAAEQRIDQLTLEFARKENVRQDTVREIYREIPKIITRPVYRNVCIDADGVRALDKAAAAANSGEDTGASESGTPKAADDPKKRQR